MCPHFPVQFCDNACRGANAEFIIIHHGAARRSRKLTALDAAATIAGERRAQLVGQGLRKDIIKQV